MATQLSYPAGLIDPNEDLAAAREFKEETGYIGKVISVCLRLACMVRIEVVDMTYNRNAQNHKRTEANGGWSLEKLLLPRIGFLDELHKLQKRDGIKVFAALCMWIII